MKIVDSHVYVGESLLGLNQSPEDLMVMMDYSGIDQAVLLPSKPKSYGLQPANSMVAEAVSQYPDRFFGFVRVDPWQKGDALIEFKRSHEKLGLKGLLLHPWEELFQVF